jgi:general secretion pathway protein A
MYTQHFGLREKPFSLTPDPRYLYMSSSHREALAHLLYGIDQGEGFIAVTGEVGTGKTTLCRTLLDRLGSRIEVAYLFNPRLDGRELLQAIHAELGLSTDGSRAQLLDRLNRFLLETSQKRRRVLIIVDEAQNLPVDTLEELRLLSNLETATEKLLQIMLFGQPELDDMLDSPELRQLRQRIGVRWRLATLTGPEASDYVRHRLRIAGSRSGGSEQLFSPGALRELLRRSRGVPRLVNLLADRALLASYADRSVRVERAHVGRAAREILAARRRRRGHARPRWSVFAGAKRTPQ